MNVGNVLYQYQRYISTEFFKSYLIMLSLLRYVTSLVGGWMDTEHWWNDTDNGKLKYPAEDLS